MNENPLHRRLRVSRTLCAFFSETGRRRVLADEKRLRRAAERIGLTATKRGWWSIVDPQEGVIAGRLSEHDAASLLSSLGRSENPTDRPKSDAMARVRRRIAQEIAT